VGKVHSGKVKMGKTRGAMTKLLIDYEIIDRDWQRPQSNCENDYCQHELDQKHT